MNTTNFTPTLEQQTIINAYNHTNKSMVVQACAGAGKTSTLIALADTTRNYHRDRVIIYMTLTKAMAVEAQKKFPMHYNNIECRTIHSIAWQACKNNPTLSPLLNKLNSPQHRETRIKTVCKKQGIVFPETLEKYPNLWKKTKNIWKQYLVSDQHGLTTEFLETLVEKQGFTNQTDINAYIVLIQDLWDKDVCSPDGILPFTHDHYLKLWCETSPDLRKVFSHYKDISLFFDEAQDSKPCVTNMLLHQNIPIVCIGDRGQNIFGFSGSQCALLEFKKTCTEYYLTQSFRYGAAIADLSNKILANIKTPIPLVQGNPNKTTLIHAVSDTVDDLTFTNAILFRTNNMLFKYALTLMRKGIRFKARFDYDWMINLVTDIHAIRNYKIGVFPSMKTEEMVRFNTVQEFYDFLNNPYPSSDDRVLKETIELLSELLDTYTFTELVDLLKAMEQHKEETVLLSTIHKAKGLEWDNVYVWGDFNNIVLRSRDELTPRDEEYMCFYVAVTRARKNLYLNSSILSRYNIHVSNQKRDINTSGCVTVNTTCNTHLETLQNLLAF